MKKSYPPAKFEMVQLTEANIDEASKLLSLCFPLAEKYPHAPWNYNGKKMTSGFLKKKVLSNSIFDPEGSFIVLLDGKLVGVSITSIENTSKSKTGYICAFAVDPHFRRQGIGELLLKNTEQYFLKHLVKKSTFSFEGNPMALYGGIPLNDDGYTFFLNRGFRCFENGILMLLNQETSKFNLTDTMQSRILKLYKSDINIVLLNTSLVDPVNKFLEMNFASWHKSISLEIKKDLLPHLLVALQGTNVIGYAGPYRVANSGLGNFHSIGITPSVRGQGVGAALFHSMCAKLKEGGAKSIALSVVNSSDALDLYLRASFKARYAVDFTMKKEYAKLEN